MPGIRALLRKILRWPDERGSVALQVALTIVVILGMVSLGVEVTSVLLTQRRMQTAADSAAVAGATALGASENVTLAADAVAAANGFTNGVNGATVTVNNPPLTGTHTANSGAVEVIVKQPQTLPIASLIYSGTWIPAARAVALSGSSASYCALQLDTSSTTGVLISNGASVNMSQCGLGANATGSTAVTVNGGAKLTASTVSVSGTTTVNNGGHISVTNGIKTNQPAMADPYASVNVPTYSGCTYSSLYQPGWTTSLTLSPGVYCGGMNIANGIPNVVMNPGVYIIKGGTFTLGGGIKITGSGVTIVLTGSGSNYATANIGNGVTVTLSAPTSGTMAGLLFYQDRNAPNSGSNILQGGAAMSLSGALYFPSQKLIMNNGAKTAATCTQLVAWRLEFQGGATLNNSCTGTGVKPIGQSSSKLVE
ncbi:MAG: pilus assembly protein TadG-related protein [Parvibaculum sedimenti]|uniref:TadE/TadG family type IV pilus assembly protein n=1 Tax=Parvibaculum sedimenti TaxID=2608632 RepID=UPI003BB700B7